MLLDPKQFRDPNDVFLWQPPSWALKGWQTLVLTTVQDVWLEKKWVPRIIILLLQMLLLKLGTELQYYTILYMKKVVRIWGVFDCDFLDSCTALGLYWERSFWIPKIKCKEDVRPAWFIKDTILVNGILNFVDHIYPGFCWVFPTFLGPIIPGRDGTVTWNDLNPVAVCKNVPIIVVWRPMFLGGLKAATLLQLHRFELSRQGLRWAMRTPMNTWCGLRGPTPTRWKWRFPPLTTLQHPLKMNRFQSA